MPFKKGDGIKMVRLSKCHCLLFLPKHPSPKRKKKKTKKWNNGMMQPKSHQLTNAFEGFLKDRNRIWYIRLRKAWLCRNEECRSNGSNHREAANQEWVLENALVEAALETAGSCDPLSHFGWAGGGSSSGSQARALTVGLGPENTHKTFSSYSSPMRWEALLHRERAPGLPRGSTSQCSTGPTWATFDWTDATWMSLEDRGILKWQSSESNPRNLRNISTLNKTTK